MQTDFGDSKLFKQEDVAMPSIQRSDTITFEDEINAKMPRGSFVGTPLYIAPEMLESNISGPFTDLWALGCILY
jgi:serine/threonine protein kinase